MPHIYPQIKTSVVNSMLVQKPLLHKYSEGRNGYQPRMVGSVLRRYRFALYDQIPNFYIFSTSRYSSMINHLQHHLMHLSGFFVRVSVSD